MAAETQWISAIAYHRDLIGRDALKSRQMPRDRLGDRDMLVYKTTDLAIEPETALQPLSFPPRLSSVTCFNYRLDSSNARFSRGAEAGYDEVAVEQVDLFAPENSDQTNRLMKVERRRHIGGYKAYFCNRRIRGDFTQQGGRCCDIGCKSVFFQAAYERDYVLRHSRPYVRAHEVEYPRPRLRRDSAGHRHDFAQTFLS